MYVRKGVGGGDFAARSRGRAGDVVWDGWDGMGIMQLHRFKVCLLMN
jgi:hypothetical protein